MSSSFLKSLSAIFKMGPKQAFRQFWIIGDMKAGTLVGKDMFGNEYFENNTDELWIRSRWVLPADDNTFDPSMIPPEWHMWLHKIDDRPPSKQLDAPKHSWIVPAFPNPTGTPQAFKTYSTTQPKIESWTPKIVERR